MKQFLFMVSLAVFLLVACMAVPTPQSSSTPTILPTATPAVAPTSTVLPTATLAPTPTSNQLVFEQVWALVRDKWVYNDDFRSMNWQQVHDEYAPRVASATTKESFYALMRELIQKLGDQRSRFLSPQEVASATQTAFGGIGASILVVSEGGVIMSVVSGGPADIAGLKVGDIIQAVDGVAYSTLEAPNPGSGIAAIRGDAGTSVRLSVQSPDGKSRLLTITRAVISASAASQSAIQVSRLPGTQVGLLVINSFNSTDLPTQIKTELQKLLQAGRLEGLIIDLRRNPTASSWNPVLGTLALFNDGGSIGTFGNSKTSTPITIPRGATIPEFKDLPLVVLISREMGLEFIPSGMQILKRARLVGVPTQGITGQWFTNNLADGSQLRLVEQFYRRPDGSSIEGKGVQPDRVVEAKWYLYINNPSDDPQIKAALEELKKK